MNIKPALTFDDVLLVPKHSKIKSRSEIDLSVDLGKGVKLSIPLVNANMKTIIGLEMTKAIYFAGGLALMHRFYDSPKDQIEAYEIAHAWTKKASYVAIDEIGAVGVSVGTLSNGAMEIIDEFAKRKVKAICVDVAHGDTEVCIDTVKYIHNKYPEILLIAGNVATGSGAQNLVDAGADIIKVGVGSGCFAAGTRVLMASGIYKNIEDIKENEYIINMNGDPKRVIKSFCTGVKKVVKIRNSIFYEDTYVTPDHKYFVGDFSTTSRRTIDSSFKILEKQSKTIPKTSKFKWHEIQNHQRFAFLMPKKIKFNLPKTFKINLFKSNGGGLHYEKTKKLDNVLTPSYELGYIFGTFLGDGNAQCSVYNNSHIGQLHWYFGLHELDIANKLKKCCGMFFDNELYIKKQNNILNCSLNYKPLADLLNNFGKHEKKFLPQEYLVYHKEYLQGIMDGLIDSDGHIEKAHINKAGIQSKSRITLSNTSIKIIELFNVICYLLNGFFPNNEKLKITAGGLNNANINNFNQPYSSRINVTAEKRVGKNYQVSKILEYSKLNINVPVYDLTIDCDTHSFIANNAIVHNSLCTTRLETGNGSPQLTALEEVYDQSDNGKKFKIIADGGIRLAGDCVKALCFSHTVMLGNVLAGTYESPGETIQSADGKEYKTYAGSSTHKVNHIEGVTGLVPCKGPVLKVIEKLLQGIRSGLSYQGSSNLNELRKNPEFILLSNAGLIESRPHDVIVVK